MIDPRRIEVIDDVTAKIYRGMSPTRKMEVLAGLYQSCRKIVEAGVRHSHPDWPDTRVNAEMLRRMRGPDWPGVAGEYHSP